MSRLLQNQLYSSYDFYFSNSFPIYAAVLLVLFYLSVMKTVFNTYSVTTAYRNYRSNERVRARYYDLFATRNNLLYHVSWAQSRREFEQAKSLEEQLQKVDEVSELSYGTRYSLLLLSKSDRAATLTLIQEIDSIESSNRQIFGKLTRVSASKGL